MKINELVKVGEETVTNYIVVDDYDADGNVIGQHIETITKVVPVMQSATRDMTPEEIAEQERMAAEVPLAEPTLEEQLADLTDLVAILAEVALG